MSRPFKNDNGNAPSRHAESSSGKRKQTGLKPVSGLCQERFRKVFNLKISANVCSKSVQKLRKLEELCLSIL